jgi:hypothetical protein
MQHAWGIMHFLRIIFEILREETVWICGAQALLAARQFRALAVRKFINENIIMPKCNYQLNAA